jgi:serine phosphatase RsbU (regulator of sigma subunit)
MDPRQRFEDVADRMGRSRRAERERPALHEGYWESVRDLFTRDVTARQFRDLFEHETRDTVRFFTRDVDFAPLETLPWYRRYPRALWRGFLAMAYRLSPPRRVLFAASVPLLFLGWIGFLGSAAEHGGVVQGLDVTLVAATLLFVLLTMELRDKLTLKGDLEIARQIQFGLLPFEGLTRDGWLVRASMRPANTVGGDYFDLVDLGDGRVAVVVGDVAGKGMPAALLMALLQGSLRTLVTAGLRGEALVAKLNAHLCANIPPNRLVTLFYAEVEPDGRLVYVNAGHNPPRLARAAGAIETLQGGGVALGILPDFAYERCETSLGSGDRLVLYTDGITEAANPRDEEFGEARLDAALSARRADAAEALLQGLTGEVLAFCGAARPGDDMTLVVVDRVG